MMLNISRLGGPLHEDKSDDQNLPVQLGFRSGVDGIGLRLGMNGL
jgi:hypothetical protein